jgi:hypothetical protein
VITPFFYTFSTHTPLHAHMHICVLPFDFDGQSRRGPLSIVPSCPVAILKIVSSFFFLFFLAVPGWATFGSSMYVFKRAKAMFIGPRSRSATLFIKALMLILVILRGRLLVEVFCIGRDLGFHTRTFL